MEYLRETPSQTVGPFFAYSLTAEQYGYAYNSIMNHALVSDQIPDNYAGAEHIYIQGRIYDGNGNAIPDAIVELWQADPLGHYRTEPIGLKNGQPDFTGLGRMGTGTLPDGQFRFKTLKPGAVDTASAPVINVTLFMRGSLRGLTTRLYFSDEAEANQQDALLSAVDSDRRHTLVAQRLDQNGQIFYTFDLYMQGQNETVFFAA
ncbi:protocatechuate 3,4-dioxygenase subunit alpha [Spirosoma pollinicola]|uniref:Protocatechuate 3,4-dioxygenase subunit alpha n=1 Tax=Spirosoma pollinicola TaxID=2057025 RepID=A0A2K8YZR1_9BACT|nr:protocatechuate 3,4-dioxygenase subunit alpha [Spirosoma pollinicola]AUD03038.1 protocatechuate 3,4-dioxygenase subunit alpha [Spirosoma pollinicola]